MYGKIFSSMYEGSMVGAGPVVFAVWGYCIAKADVDGTLLLNPALLAPIIGTSRVDIEGAINYLLKPDPHSKNPEHEGRRLLHQSGYQYFVVSHEHYRDMKNNEDRREYMREYMRKKREKQDVNINKINTKLTKVNPASASSSVSATNSSLKGDCQGEARKPSSPAKKQYGSEFGNVRLTEQEYERLSDKCGGIETRQQVIDKLDIFLETKPKAYKSHYAAILKWVINAVKEDQGKPTAANYKSPAEIRRAAQRAREPDQNIPVPEVIFNDDGTITEPK